MAAEITINQPTGAGAGTPGESRADIWLSRQVNLVSSGTGSTYLWEVLDRPPGSVAPLNNSTMATANITPDMVGSYRVRLKVNGGVAVGDITTRIMRVRYTSTGVLTKRGWVTPAVEENDDEDNGGGNTRGWAPQIETITSETSAALTTLVFRPGGGVDAGHVFEDWEVLMETFSDIEGPVTIEIDDSTTSPAVIPAGTWDMENRAFFIARSVTPRAALRLANGATVGDPLKFQQIVVNVTGSDVGTITLSAGSPLFIEDCDFSNSSTGGPVLSIGANTVTVRGTSALSTATAQPVIQLGAAATLIVEDSASIGADSLSGTSVTVNLVGVSSSCSSTQTGIGSLTINSPIIPEPYTFVFRPGYAGPSKDNVYTNWATLMGALAPVRGPKVVQFDDQDGACQIPSGTWDFGYETTLRGLAEGSTGVTVTVLTGGVLDNVYALDQGLILKSTSSAAILSWSLAGASVPYTLHLDNGATLNTTGASTPFYTLSTGNHLIVEMRGISVLQSAGVAVFNLTQATASLTIRQFDQSYVSSSVVTRTAGTGVINLLSDVARIKQSEVTGLTINRVASRRRVIPFSRSNITEATGTPTIVGAAYIDPEEIPNYNFWSNLNMVAKYRVIIETTAPGQAAVMDIFDINGVFNSGTPAPITGSQQDTATGTGPSRPGGGTPLTPNPLVASAYEVDVSSVFFGGSWTNSGIYEARLWIATPGGGNVATCKSSELIIEW